MVQHGKHRTLVKLAALAVLAGILVPVPAFACRLALLLAIDVSSSIDDQEYVLQRDGLATALVSPEVTQAFFHSPDPVALAVYEWSGQNNQKLVIDWQLISGAQDLHDVADRLRRSDSAVRVFPTSLGNALRFGAQQLRRAPRCHRRTIDVSGDGMNNDGYPPEVAYRHFPFDDVTVNALAIGGAEDLNALVRYFSFEVLRGPGAFVETAFDHNDFQRAIRRKLERELKPQIIGQTEPSDWRVSNRISDQTSQ